MSNWPSRSGEEMNGDSRRWADIMSGCREAPEFISFSLSYSVNRTSGIPKQILSRHYSLSRPSVYIFFSVTLNGVRFSVFVGHSWEQSEYLFLTHSLIHLIEWNTFRESWEQSTGLGWSISFSACFVTHIFFRKMFENRAIFVPYLIFTIELWTDTQVKDTELPLLTISLYEWNKCLIRAGNTVIC